MRRALKFAAGAAFGIALWWLFTPQYQRVLAFITQPLLHIDRRLKDAVLVPQDRAIFVTSSTPLPTATIPADQLTYNVVLLLGLFASNTLAMRNLKSLAIAAAIVFAFQSLGLIISIESTYALRQGAWSEQHYSDAAGHAWLTAELVFRTVGMFGVVFACWWALTNDRANAARALRDANG